jgi:putative spermidine/putrescine transport system permease protein
LRFIYIPLLILKVRNIILLYAIFLLGTFEVALLLGRSQPRTISIYITEKLTKFNLQDIPLGHSMAVLYLILVFALISILLRKRKVDLI